MCQVWTYLFDECGVEFTCNDGETITMADVLWALPTVRSNYASVDVLGHDFFKLQCYFITHLVYVMSDWGQHPLRRELFLEELQFIVDHFNQVRGNV